MLRGLSYRLRLPLSLVATALFTALVLSLVIAWHTYRNVRVELIDNGIRLGSALASALQPALLHDDVWLAYSTLRGPRTASAGPGATLVLVDGERRIFASNVPRVLPVAVLLREADPELAAALSALRASPSDEVVFDLEALPDQLLFSTPITSDGVSVGELLLVYPRQVLWPRFTTIIWQGGWSVLLVLAVIVPVGWFWGRRMVRPLVRLADCMVRVRDENPELIECSVAEGDDEIGRLNRRFRELLTALREKAGLERRMVSSERLAAVGRLAAGVAHEINNPLGGMLVAIDTQRRRGVTDGHTERTLSLLERGLTQIRDTVSALLVEARPEPHSLTAQDIEDTRTLVSTHADKRDVRIKWDNRLSEPLALPSTLVRQVAINLLLNAVQSAPRGGRVAAVFRPERDELSIRVNNDGEAMDRETLDHLFEPYYTNRNEGSGLGLWVTYQIVRQLGGGIQTASRDGDTWFVVTLPLSSQEIRRDAA
ncbi:MAG: ATP-binding protein [Pseudomonadota bacterium]|nr:ATP-binding protein [Pseudomonadota bacterium]